MNGITLWAWESDAQTTRLLPAALRIYIRVARKSQYIQASTDSSCCRLISPGAHSLLASFNIQSVSEWLRCRRNSQTASQYWVFDAETCSTPSSSNNLPPAHNVCGLPMIRCTKSATDIANHSDPLHTPGRPRKHSSLHPLFRILNNPLRHISSLE